MKELKKKQKKCTYCDREASARGFCKRDHRHLLQMEIDMSNIEECIKCLKLRDKRHRISNIKKCLYCTGTEKIVKGFCYKHYIYLKRHNIDINDIKECIKILKEKDNKKQHIEKEINKSNGCIYCGSDEKLIRGFCNKHYECLRRNDIDIDNIEESISFLENHYNEIKKCLYCNKKHDSKGFCKIHYERLRRNGIDFSDKEKCIEFLRKKDSQVINNKNKKILRKIAVKQSKDLINNYIKEEIGMAKKNTYYEISITEEGLEDLKGYDTSAEEMAEELEIDNIMTDFRWDEDIDRNLILVARFKDKISNNEGLFELRENEYIEKVEKSYL